MITVRCRNCLEQVKIDVAFARQQLRWKQRYAFGDHVSDSRAFVMRWLTTLHGWIYLGVPLGKTTITMLCLSCRERRRPVLPTDPEELSK